LISLLLPSVSLLTKEYILALPPNLLYLRVDQISEPVRLLPSTLTYLKFSLPSLDPFGSQVGLSELPPHLTELRLGGEQAHIPALPAWPPKLTKLKVPWTFGNPQFSELPPMLSTLILQSSCGREEDEDVAVLPKSVTLRYYSDHGRLFDCVFRLPLALCNPALFETHDTWIKPTDAARTGRLDVLKWMHSLQGMKWFVSGRGSTSCLAHAASAGQLQVVIWFLSLGMDWREDIQDTMQLGYYGRHPRAFDLLLTIPTFRSHKAVLLHLLKKNEIATLWLLHQTPGFKFPDFVLRLACHFSSLKTLEVLVEKCGVDVNVVDPSSGQTALQFLVTFNSIPTAKYLFSKGAKVDILDERGYTLAHILCEQKTVPVQWVQWLKEVGLDFKAPCPKGITPADLLKRSKSAFNQEAQLLASKPHGTPENL
jgi:hypothetical protein